MLYSASDISASLTGILRPLDALKELQLPDANTSVAAKRDLERVGVANAVNKTGDACDMFAKRLEEWIKYSSGQKLSLLGRAKVMLNKERIKTLRVHFQSWRSTVELALQTTQL